MIRNFNRCRVGIAHRLTLLVETHSNASLRLVGDAHPTLLKGEHSRFFVKCGGIMRGINHPRYDTYCMVAPILYGRLYFDLQKIGNASVKSCRRPNKKCQTVDGENTVMKMPGNNMKLLRFFRTKFFLTVTLIVLSYALPAYAQENVWKELHDETASLLQSKRYADGIKSGQEALKIAEKTFPPGHVSIAASMNLLGILYRTYGRYAEAEPLFNKALSIYKETLGPDHSNVAYVQQELAEMYLLQDKYAEAEPFYQQSLKIYEDMYGPYHPSVINVLNRLGELYQDQKKYAEAIPVLKRALAIEEEIYGPDNPDIASSMNNLATLYYYQGENTKAEILYKEALEIYEKEYGVDHPLIATILEKMAEFYKGTGKENEAKQVADRAKKIYSNYQQ
ncbi:MAG: tetratricopeptide repeat protein [Planctomycetes bacterium]|nr:tetratricopeptide repeat protein [Planctomycetota bacterium]